VSQVLRFDLSNRADAYRRLRELIHRDLANKRIPTFQMVHICGSGDNDTHYMTPISFEPVDERGTRMANIFDFDFFLRLFLSLKSVVDVEYDPSRPAVIFTIVTTWCD